MEHVAGHVDRCDGCARDLPAAQGSGPWLCDGSATVSAQIDALLAVTRPEDPVRCDGCDGDVTFDARVAVVVRGCGGAVLCGECCSLAGDDPS